MHETELGVLVYNTHYWPEGKKIVVVNQILYTACHELAHENYKNHSKRHQLLTESLFRKVNNIVNYNGQEDYPIDIIRRIL